MTLDRAIFRRLILTSWIALVGFGCGGSDKPPPEPTQESLEKEAAEQQRIHTLEMKGRGAK